MTNNKTASHLSLFLSVALASALMLSSCVQTVKPVDQKPAETKPTVEVQQALAMDHFREMLANSTGVPREEAVPGLVKGYDKIMNEYPESYLAEESYLRLISLYLTDFYPPKYDEIAALYKQYKERYPKAKMLRALNEVISRNYYQLELWDKLSAFVTPFVREYVKRGSIEEPLLLYYYTEAKFNQKDYAEARKGFNMLLDRVPGSQLAEFAQKRLEAIKKIEEAAEQKTAPAPAPTPAPAAKP